jgi:hypothetical protein
MKKSKRDETANADSNLCFFFKQISDKEKFTVHDFLCRSALKA